MTSKIENKAKNIVAITLEYSAEEFVAALQAAYKANAKRFSVPGFRKGKAPYQLVIRYYGEGVLYDDAIDHLINDGYGKALDEHELQPVARPELDVTKIGSEEGLTAILTVTTKPEVELGQYEGIEAIKTVTVIDDTKVEEEVSRLRERSGRMVPVEDRPAQEGDLANIDFKGYLDGELFDGGEGSNYDLKLGSGTFIPGFEDQVINHQIGEEFDVNVTFPEDYNAEELKGKEVVFKVKLNGLKFKELPELDDEFAKDISEFDTLADFKADLKVKLQEKADTKDNEAFENQVMEIIVANATVDIPEVMVDNEVDETISRQEQSMRYQGIELNQYLQYLGQTLEEYKKGMREDAKVRVKAGLVLDALTKTLDLPVSDEDYEAGIERIAKSQGMPLEQFKEYFKRDNEMILRMIQRELTIKHVIAKAKPVETK